MKKGFEYVTEAEPASKGQTAVFRNKEYPKLVTNPSKGQKTMQDVILRRCEENPDYELFGYREATTEGPENKITWMTGKEVLEKAKALGSGMIKLGLTAERAEFRNYHLRFIAVWGINSIQWILTDFANSLYNFTTMPIYDTLGEEATIHMFNETKSSTCFLTSQHVKGLVGKIRAQELPNLRNLVIMDEWNLNDAVENELKSSEVKWFRFEEVVEKGLEEVQPLATVAPEDIQAFSYTSGTTGKPKGAMISHSAYVAAIGGAEKAIPMKLGEGLHISYLPLAHVMEKIVMGYLVIMNGRAVFYNGDNLKIKEDLALVKPTMFVSVPRLFTKFYQKIKERIDGLTGCKACLAKKGVNTKLQNYRKTGKVTHWLWDKLVFNKMKAILGGQVRFMLTGSAPISNDVKEFLQIAFCCPLANGYGQTENMGGSFIHELGDITPGIVGGPLPHIEYKLIDVPEMNYYSTDKDEEGRPRPRGEILTRGPSHIPGYYKNEEKTSEAFDQDGWLHSGDIGMILPEHKALKIFDRRKNIFKLSQGEYVAPDKIEQIIKTVAGMGDVFVHGDSEKSFLVAVVHYDEDTILPVAEKLGIKEDYSQLCTNQDLKAHMLKEINTTGRSAGLKGFEIPKAILVERVPFGDLELITSTFKLKRHLAKKHYEKKLEELYEEFEAKAQ